MGIPSDKWPAQVEKMIADHPSLASFVDLYESGSGAGRGVFRGQLCRTILDVIAQPPPKALEVLQARCPKLEEDFLLALRFLYYVKAKPVVPDAMYDAAERDYLARPEVDDTPLMNPGSDNANDYPEHVRALAFYLSMIGWQGGQEAAAQVELPLGDPRKPASPAPVIERRQEKQPRPKKKPAGYFEAEPVGDLF